MLKQLFSHRKKQSNTLDFRIYSKMNGNIKLHNIYIYIYIMFLKIKIK